MTRCRSFLAHGASVKPQLPMTTLVMPCQQGRRPERIPEDLGVHVGVPVHEPRRDDPALRVDGPLGRSRGAGRMATIFRPFTPTSPR